MPAKQKLNISHTFHYSYQTGSQSQSQSVLADPGVLLTTSWTASSPDLTRLKALSPSNKNTKAQKHYFMTIVVDNDSVIKLQYKKRNPSWRISSLRQTARAHGSVCHPACPSLYFISCSTTSAFRLMKPASAACQSVSLWLRVGLFRLTARQADTARRWGDRHHSYTRVGWQHLGILRQRVLKDQCAAFWATRWGTQMMK